MIKIPLREYWPLLKHYLVPQRGAAILMALLLLASIGLQLLGPQAARAFIDAAQTGASERSLRAFPAGAPPHRH